MSYGEDIGGGYTGKEMIKFGNNSCTLPHNQKPLGSSPSGFFMLTLMIRDENLTN